MKKKVLQALKPKAASLGFIEKELEWVANQIAETMQEDATDEQIDTQIDAVIPYLKVAQSAVTRIVNASKEKPTQKEEPKPKGSENPDDDEPAWFRKYREENDAKIAGILEGKSKETRRKVFETLLKDLTPKQREAKLKDFDRISFKDDDDFEAYKEEQTTLIAEIVQENANSNLGKVRQPFGGGGKGGDKPSEEELKKVFGK